jgi:zinc protease
MYFQSIKEMNPIKDNIVTMMLGMFMTLALVLSNGDTTLGQSNSSLDKSKRSSATEEVNKLEKIKDVKANMASLVTEYNINGLKVLIKRRSGSLTVAAGLFLRGGSRNITPENAGIESLMLEAATESSVKYPRDRMRRELARMGTVISAGASRDYSALALTSTRQHFDQSWDMFIDVALNPSFVPEEVKLVQNRLMVSLNDDADDPDSYLQLLQEQKTYAGHPYINRPEGTAESMGSITIEGLRRYHKQMMETSRLLLVIVGDLDPSKLKTKISNSLGKLPRGKYEPKPLPELTFSSPSVDVTPRDLPTNYIQGVYVAPSLTSDDIYPMRIASSILRDRVFEEVRTKRNLSYAPNAFLSSQGANLGGIYVTAVDANRAVSVMMDEITRLQRDLITRDDITATVAQFLTTYYLGQETNSAQLRELAMYELNGGSWRNSIAVIEKLQNVKPEDVQRVARKYMRNLQFVVIGNPKSVDKTIFTRQETSKVEN